MNKEYSCGGLVYKLNNDTLKFLVIKQVNGNHYGFPKGHMEENETKEETAYREILEETNIKTIINKNAFVTINYEPKPGITKEVTYFLAKALNTNISFQAEEVLEAYWLTYNEVLNILTYQNDFEVLKKLFKLI